MKGSRDDNDTVPDSILYYYPKDNIIAAEQINECGYIGGIVQYFQHDLFHSIPKTFYFQKNVIAHKHFGRHSGFLSVQYERYTEHEAHIHLNHILNIFHMIYGTWSHIYSIHGSDLQIKEFLDRAMTPIAEHVCSLTRTIPQVLSTIEYTPLKNGNQRILLESKHFLEHLKLNYGLIDGLIGFDNKLLYSTWDTDTTFYIQTILQLKKTLPKDLLYTPLVSQNKLKNGVSLFRIYIRESPDGISIPTTNFPNRNIKNLSTPQSTIPSRTNNFLHSFSSSSDTVWSVSGNLSYYDSISINHRNRMGILLSDSRCDSSSEAGVETDTNEETANTDTNDELPRINQESTISTKNEAMLSSSKDSLSESSSKPWMTESLTDERKLELVKATKESEFEDTIKIDPPNNAEENVDRIYLMEVATFSNEDYSNDDGDSKDEVDANIQLSNESFRQRTITVTNFINIPETLEHDDQEAKASWKNMSAQNYEHERTELVLFIQKNSRMMFVGVMPQNLITDEYIQSLWHFLLSRMAYMETEIQAISTEHETFRTSADSKFQFTETTHRAEFERVSDGKDRYLKVPFEDSICLAVLARSELKKDSTRHKIALSRGNHLVAVDRFSPDRTNYSYRLIQDVS